MLCGVFVQGGEPFKEGLKIGISAEWALSNKTKNRIAHAYNGNTQSTGNRDLPDWVTEDDEAQTFWGDLCSRNAPDCVLHSKASATAWLEGDERRREERQQEREERQEEREERQKERELARRPASQPVQSPLNHSPLEALLSAFWRWSVSQLTSGHTKERGSNPSSSSFSHSLRSAATATCEQYTSGWRKCCGPKQPEANVGKHSPPDAEGNRAQPEPVGKPQEGITEGTNQDASKEAGAERAAGVFGSQSPHAGREKLDSELLLAPP